MPDLARFLENRTLIVLSNREPYEHVQGSAGIEVKRPAGGLVSALDPTMRRTRGTWVAWGSGSADRESADPAGRVCVPPDDPSYTLRRVWLERDDVDNYYQGFSNSVLWPLCHMLIQHFEFRQEYWDSYRAVNRRFADAAAEEAGRAPAQPLVWIQDYHLALAAAELRARDPSLFIHQFWHIPFPPPDILHLLPTEVHDELLRGLLGNDLLGFHTERYAWNFLDCVAEAFPDVEVDSERFAVRHRGRTTYVGAFPISIDAEWYEQLALRAESAERVARLRERYAGEGGQLGVSVDRIDYTKGIPERLEALGRLWEQAPELRGCFSLLQVATPSRSEVPAYKALEHDVVAKVQAINERYGTDTWTPIIFIHSNVDAEMLASAYRAADLCLVSSLQDGMNLVAKEFIACQVDERGVLVLSRFTGAAQEIDGAVLINPFNVDGFAAGIRHALGIPPEERRRRMREMRAQLHESTIFDWLELIMGRAASIMGQGEPRVATV
ncbi:MAG TPA: trehalose-6-phosphate synthase [Gemmatimonadaceae bacterium]|nr:trehalose-6-phosphate synthase [Gemmatimonadaceae bacterium]